MTLNMPFSVAHVPDVKTMRGAHHFDIHQGPFFSCKVLQREQNSTLGNSTPVCFLKRLGMDHHVIEFPLTSVGWAWMFAQADVELGNQHAKIFSQIHFLGTRFSGPNPLAFAHILFLFFEARI